MRRLNDALKDITHNHYSNGRTGPRSKINPTIGVRTTHPDFVGRLNRVFDQGAIIGQFRMCLGDVSVPSPIPQQQSTLQRIYERSVGHERSVYRISSWRRYAAQQS